MKISKIELTCARCLKTKKRVEFPRLMSSHRVQLCTDCKKIVTKENNEAKYKQRTAEWKARTDSAKKLSNDLNDKIRSDNQKVTYSHETRTAIEDTLQRFKDRKDDIYL